MTLTERVRGFLGSRRETLGPIDPVLFAVTVALIAFGVVMVFSASAVYASQSRFTHHEGHYYLVRQGFFAAIAVPWMALVASFDYRRYRAFSLPMVIGAIALMILTLVIGRSAGGATRWIQIGSFNIQAAEVAKVALVFWLAHSLSKKKHEQVRDFKVGVLPHLIVAGILALLSLRQNDLGSAIMLGIITFAMLFAGGAKLGPIVSFVLSAVGVAAAVIAFSPFRRARMEAFLNPFEHRQGAGYQVVESILSFGSGGLTGVGLGDSHQKLFFLPEAHNDFIGAIVGEELGFVGVMTLIGAFAIFTVRGFRIGIDAHDEHGSLLAVGITTFLSVSAFANLAVAMGLLPTKGLVLPFVSYGGSSLLVCATAVGALLNVSRSRVAEGGSSTSTGGGQVQVGIVKREPRAARAIAAGALARESS